MLYLLDHATSKDYRKSVAYFFEDTRFELTMLVIQGILDIVDSSISYGELATKTVTQSQCYLRIPQPSNSSSHSFVLLFVVSSSMYFSNVSLCSTLFAFVLNFSSVIHSGFPTFVARIPKRRSLPPPSNMSPSDVLKAL
jgi:hypothetical protein